MVRSIPTLIASEHRGALLAVDGLVLTLSSPKAFPPGQPLTLALELEPPLSLEARSIGSKRSDASSYELRVRLINLRKTAREALERALASGE